MIHAIQNLYLLQFTHQKHWEDFSTQREVKPIAIKELNNSDGIWLL